MKKIVKNCLVTVALSALTILAVNPASAELVFEDTFNRTNSDIVGTTSDGNFTWTEAEDSGSHTYPWVLSIKDNAAQISPYNKGGMGIDTGYNDGSLVMSINPGNNDEGAKGFITYRAPSTNEVDYQISGYISTTKSWHVEILNENTIELRWGNGTQSSWTEVVASTNLPAGVPADDYWTLVIQWEGQHHRAYYLPDAGAPVELYNYTETDPSRYLNTRNCIGFGTYTYYGGSSTYVDWVQFSNDPTYGLPPQGSIIIIK